LLLLFSHLAWRFGCCDAPRCIYLLSSGFGMGPDWGKRPIFELELNCMVCRFFMTHLLGGAKGDSEIDRYVVSERASERAK